jgi:hypothetical protein
MVLPLLVDAALASKKVASPLAVQGGRVYLAASSTGLQLGGQDFLGCQDVDVIRSMAGPAEPYRACAAMQVGVSQ